MSSWCVQELIQRFAPEHKSALPVNVCRLRSLLKRQTNNNNNSRQKTSSWGRLAMVVASVLPFHLIKSALQKWNCQFSSDKFQTLKPYLDDQFKKHFSKTLRQLAFYWTCCSYFSLGNRGTLVLLFCFRTPRRKFYVI